MSELAEPAVSEIEESEYVHKANVDEDANVSLEQWANPAAAEHQYELEERGSVGLNLDHRVTGLGGTPTDPLDRYQVPVESTTFSVVLRPFDPDSDDPMALANRRLPGAQE
ncbi:beta-galactosidase small subunit [Haloferax sp. AB510]|uniref:beta-galactosidase small subunit n=1 Tax=Haloferax sp. AB510 TaxID=2934172 RepID=UPI00209C3520|nr:beta-galactosidase small subunit [Haloferax sp. AB510]MCO8268030.1 beta-galactosidase small subunit [Haloferax sp. AB510]